MFTGTPLTGRAVLAASCFFMRKRFTQCGYASASTRAWNGFTLVKTRIDDKMPLSQVTIVYYTT